MPRVPWRGIAEGVGLVLALSFVFAMQFIPHLDTFTEPVEGEAHPVTKLGAATVSFLTGEREGFPWAIHVDELIHSVYIEKVQRWDQVHVGEAYGDAPPEQEGILSLRGSVHEKGYHLLMAQFQELTGIETSDLYLYGPSIWMVFMAFSVYALMRPHPGAVVAAAAVGLAPTTVRFLGPAFLVPIAFVLAWLPVTAILSEPAKKRTGAAVLLLAVVVWAFFVHLIGGFAAVAILGLGALLGQGRSKRELLTFFLIALIPILWIWNAFQGAVQQEIDREQFLPTDLGVFESFGIIALFVWGIGLLLMTVDPPEENRGPIVSMSALGVFAFGLIIGGRVLDLNSYATYARWHPPFYIAASVPIGFAVGTAIRRTYQWVTQALSRVTARWRPVQRWAPPIVAVALIVGLLVPAAGAATLRPVDRHMRQPYYHIMEQPTWESFVWVDENVGPAYERYLSEPWAAPFLAEMSGKDPHAVLLPGAPPREDADWRAYLDKRAGLEMYVMNDITLVVGPHNPDPDHFDEVGPDVYAMDEDVAREIARIRAMEQRR